MSRTISIPPHKAVIRTAIAATVLIGTGAFILSFAALTDLAVYSGIPLNLAWIWPVIVDGMIVAATFAIVALNDDEPHALRYPWALLIFGSVVSTAANSLHAIVNVSTEALPIIAAVVAAMPPVVLLAITHLTVHLFQRQAAAAVTLRRPAVKRSRRVAAAEKKTESAAVPVVVTKPAPAAATVPPAKTADRISPSKLEGASWAQAGPANPTLREAGRPMELIG
jgi:hypothetical protein